MKECDDEEIKTLMRVCEAVFAAVRFKNSICVESEMTMKKSLPLRVRRSGLCALSIWLVDYHDSWFCGIHTNLYIWFCSTE